MAIEVLAIHHVGVRIDPAKVDETRKFYLDVLGFSADLGRPNFSVGGDWINVARSAQIHTMAVAGNEERFPGDPTLPHIAYAVEDIEEARLELGKLGIRHWVSDNETARLSQVCFDAPAGNRIELHQDDACRCAARR